MTVRPPIPIEIRRRVLIEAGHRCAIPTCKYHDVDVHHIVPWNKCLEHRFENLLALCPNCHRRVHRGEIDRKSLLLYKARLQALFGPELITDSKEDNVAKIWISSSTEDYDTAVFSESNHEHNYDIKIEYPEFIKDIAPHLNKRIRELVEKTANNIINAAKNPERLTDLPFNLVGSFNVALYTKLAVSIRFSFKSFTGGAHSNNWTEVINYRKDLLSDFKIGDIFLIIETGIKKISDYSIEILNSLKDRCGDKEHIKRGAGPEVKNFVKFNLSTEGILVTFDEYQVGCYAEGKLEVLIPYALIRPIASDFIETLITEHGGIENY